MQQIDIFEALSNPATKQYFLTNKTNEAFKIESYDWTTETPKKIKILMNHTFKDKPKSYECKYCGAETIYHGKEVNKNGWYCLVDDNWQCIETFCSECVNDSVGAEWCKKERYNTTFKAKDGIWYDTKVKQHETLSLIKYNKRTRKVLIKNRDNFHYGIFSAKPYLINSNVQFCSEEKRKINRKQFHLRNKRR